VTRAKMDTGGVNVSQNGYRIYIYIYTVAILAQVHFGSSNCKPFWTNDIEVS
jgi:hypothetical protein